MTVKIKACSKMFWLFWIPAWVKQEKATGSTRPSKIAPISKVWIPRIVVWSKMRGTAPRAWIPKTRATWRGIRISGVKRGLSKNRERRCSLPLGDDPSGRQRAKAAWESQPLPPLAP